MGIMILKGCLYFRSQEPEQIAKYGHGNYEIILNGDSFFFRSQEVAASLSNCHDRERNQ